MSPEEHSDWLLERVHLGEVAAHLEHRAQLLANDDAAQLRLASMAREQEDFAAQAHRLELDEIRRIAAARIRTDEAARRSSRRRTWGIAVPLAAMGLVLAVFPWHTSNGIVSTAPLSDSVKSTQAIVSIEPLNGNAPNNQRPSTASSTPATSREAMNPDAVAGSGSVTNNPIRSKGEEISFLIHCKRQGSTTRLSSGDTVVAGDMLQISVEVQRMEYLCIVSIDSNGALTAHLPETPTRAMVVDSGMRMILPHAYELDASPGYERFLLFWSHSPFETSRVLSAIRALPPSQRRQGIPELEGIQARALIFPKGQR